jgi:DNA-binding NtrC family response regulator
MVAPVRVGEQLHALLYVDRLESPAAFTREDLEFLEAVANQLAVRLANLTEVADLEAEVARLRRRPVRGNEAPAIIGRDPAILRLLEQVAKAAPTHAPVLVLGESGTGKELVARSIHLQSRRCDAPLQVINCAAIAEGLVESTLFGHVKGAFTGADDTRPGVFELADGGTLFLDEIGELPLTAQAKLLRALEQGEVQRIGDPSPRRVDVRLIAATNRDLETEAAAARFRPDLLHRLDVLALRIPPLRERTGDIDLLIDHILREQAVRHDRPCPELSPEARTLLLRHPWPGNVRQLRNALERSAILCTGGIIRPEDLPEAVRGRMEIACSTPVCPLVEVERFHILRMLDHFGGNKKAAAEGLAIDRSTLYAKLRQYGRLDK